MQKLPSMILDDPGCPAIEVSGSIALRKSQLLILNSMSLKFASTSNSSAENPSRNWMRSQLSSRLRFFTEAEETHWNSLESLSIIPHVSYRFYFTSSQESKRTFADDIIPGHAESYPLSPCIILHYLLTGYRELPSRSPPLSLSLEMRRRLRASLILSRRCSLLLFYSDHALTFSFDLLALPPVRRTVAIRGK